MKMDFICVGFPKCGTTTLDSILRQYKDVNLPIVKEPHFFRWKDSCEEPLVKLYNDYYYENKENKITGMIDPTLTRVPINELDRYFGSKTKILIMLRNPVKTLFSEFKMGLRLGYYWGYYSPFKKSSISEMFDQYVEDALARKSNYSVVQLFCYEDYLKEVFSAREKKDIKVIIFEEFIKNPNAYKEEIETFLGIAGGENVDYQRWENKGDGISKNYFCARFNHWIRNLAENSNITVKKIGIKMKHLYKYTTAVDSGKITDITQSKCEKIYLESKNQIEALLDKDLSGLWFE